MSSQLLAPRSPSLLPAVTAGFRSAKYTPHEWRKNNADTLWHAEAAREQASRTGHEAAALRAEAEGAAARAQADGTRRLGARMQETHARIAELERHAALLLRESELLRAQRRRLEKALDATEIPFAVATDNLNCREKRFGGDLVRDPVEEELLKEVELIRNVQSLLKTTLDQAVNQIRLNETVKQALELDWSDKQQAYRLDEQCGRYSNRSTDTQHHPSSAAVHSQLRETEEWERSTQDNVARAEKEEEASGALRQLCDQVLQETAENLQAQNATVQENFTRRCEELTQAKTQLELQLAQVLEQIGAQERNISSLQQAVYDKEAPLRVAQSRLHYRAQRPSTERCRDQPHVSLVEEVEQICSSVEILQQQLRAAQESLEQLKHSRMMLEKDISCKTHSLYIDRDKCMKQRTHYPNMLALTGY